MTAPANPIFPVPEHVGGFSFYNRQVYSAMFRRVRVHPWVTEVKTLTDDIYGEDLSGTWPEAQIYETPAYFAEMPGWRAKLTKQGLDEDRPLIGCFNQSILTDGKNPFPKLGDLVEVITGPDSNAVGSDATLFGTSDFYKVMQENPSDLFANLSVDKTFTWTVTLNRHRYESVSRGDVRDKAPADLSRSPYGRE